MIQTLPAPYATKIPSTLAGREEYGLGTGDDIQELFQHGRRDPIQLFIRKKMNDHLTTTGPAFDLNLCS